MTALNEGLSQPQSRKALHPVMERLGKIKKEYQGVAHHYDTDVVLSPKTDRLEKITWMPNEAYRQASQASGCYTIATTQTQWSLDDMVNHYNQLGGDRTHFSIAEIGTRTASYFSSKSIPNQSTFIYYGGLILCGSVGSYQNESLEYSLPLGTASGRTFFTAKNHHQATTTKRSIPLGL